MRKRVINHVADTIFWYILYFLPVLAYLMFVISAPFKDEVSDTIVPEPTVFYDYKVHADSELIANSGILRFPIPYNTMCFPVLNYGDSSSSLIYGQPLFFLKEDTEDQLLAFLASTDIPFALLDPKSDPVNEATVLNDFVISFSSKVDIFSQNIFFFFCSDPLGTGTLMYFAPQSSYLNISFVGTHYEYSDIPVLALETYDFKAFVNSMGFEFATDNIIVNSLADIFGTGGIMPMFDNDTPFIIFAWFIGVYLLHLLVDFLLFIPRIAHKWMKDCTGGD